LRPIGGTAELYRTSVAGLPFAGAPGGARLCRHRDRHAREKIMKAPLRGSTILAGLGLAATMSQAALGLDLTTALTSRRHTVAAGASAPNLEGAACPAPAKMVSGACHPGYNDHVAMINQYPNLASNTWRCGFKNNTARSVAIWIYTLCARSEGGDHVADDVVQHRLQVRRHSSANLTNADADGITAAASTILQTNDGAGDVGCPVALSRDGDVNEFAEGDGSIDSEAEFSALVALPGWVKVVSQINWCGALIPNVIGCAPVPGTSLAVVRFDAGLEGHLWAHEFGHNKGLSHRNDDPDAVMNGVIGDTHRRITAAECDAYKIPPAAALMAAAGPPQPGPMPQQAQAGPASQSAQAAAAAPGAQAAAMNIRDFVRQIFIHGVPYEEVSGYDASVVPTLLEMLNDPAEQQYWPNIVVVLGMIGDQRAVDPLISFIEAHALPDGLSRRHYAAKTSALMALGYLVNKSGDRKALDYLKASATPDAWAAKDISGIAPFQRSVSERNRDFSKYAILGLALTGSPEAAQVLRQLQVPAASPTTREFQAQVGDVISEALRENQKISEQGLMNYYRAQRR
jgi:hypothetical protein